MFSPNGKSFITTKDSKVTIWNTLTGTLIHDLPPVNTEIYSAAFITDRRVFIVGKNGSAKLYDLDLNAFISASGVVTFDKSKDLASTFKDIPNNKILVETDAPYLAPVPMRGKSNEPSYIIHTVKFLAVLKKLTFNEFSEITTENFFKLFGDLK